MGNLDGYDASEHEPFVGFEPIPEGWYTMTISASEDKDNASGSGTHLQLTFEILDGPYKGRFVWEQLNLQHRNDMVVKYAKGTLSAICRAVDVMRPRDSYELHDKPLMVHVKVVKRKDTGELSNRIGGYRKIGSPIPGTSKVVPPPSSPPPQSPQPPLPPPPPPNETMTSGLGPSPYETTTPGPGSGPGPGPYL